MFEGLGWGGREGKGREGKGQGKPTFAVSARVWSYLLFTDQVARSIAISKVRCNAHITCEAEAYFASRIRHGLKSSSGIEACVVHACGGVGGGERRGEVRVREVQGVYVCLWLVRKLRTIVIIRTDARCSHLHRHLRTTVLITVVESRGLLGLCREFYELSG